MSKARLVITPAPSSTAPSPKSPATTAWPAPGSAPSWPATTSRAKPRSPPLPHPEDQPPRTPATVYTARPKTAPGTDRSTDTHDRVRTDRVSKAGSITLRHSGTLYRIGIGRTYTGTYVLALVQDLDIRIINAATGEILRELALDPTVIYQRTGRPPGPTPK